MNRTDNSGKGIAGLGRGEDSMLAHVAPGEMVVPPVISPQTQKIIEQEMMSAGLDPSEYTVGQGMSINPITGMAEFGFLKKLGKSLKKVVKKVAPIAGVVLPFIPGFQALTPALQGAISGGLGKASGLSTKDALLGGLTVGMGAKFRNARQAAAGAGGITDAASKAKRPLFGKEGRFRDFFVKGSDDKNFLDNVFGGLRGGGDQEVMYEDQFGNEVSAAEYAAMSDVDKPMYSQVRSPNIVRRLLGSTPGQSGIGVIEDLIKGRESDFTKERGEGGGLLGSMTGSTSGGGLNPALLAMAALYGKAVKSDFEKKEGGLKDVRQSVRPDLMPAPTFQGFDLGIRPGMKYGGSMDEEELDMRMGGPSIGPGTGTSDDIPAMLSDGEFVMTSAANNGLGGFKVTKTETGIELIPSGKPNRQKGAKNMDKLMKTFEQFNKVGQA